MLQTTIAAKRKERGLRRADLASLIGVSASAVGLWEQGRSIPRLTHLEHLAAVLDLSFVDLCHMAAAAERAGRKK